MKTVSAKILVLVMGATHAFSAPGKHGSALRPATEAEERIKRTVNDHAHNGTREHELESHDHGSNETQVHGTMGQHGINHHHHEQDIHSNYVHEEGTHGHSNNETHIQEITDHDDHENHHGDHDDHDHFHDP
ncbi:protein catecholamines up-like [Penaeus indicus]|uniref:protein catecholamines up-like n=1 Tax=Penaeus indicus TaxID=29960 RepID=UPI00300D0C84